MTFRKLSPWLSRLFILAVAGLFTVVGLRFILDPLHTAAESGFTLDSAVGYTNVRAGVGGFPLGFAMILTFSLFSSRRLWGALASIATIDGVLLVIRLYGAAHDHTFSQSARILIPEVVVLVFSLVGVRVETRRRALAR